MQMSGFPKVEMSAWTPQWRHGGDGGADDGGTGPTADHDPAGRAAAEPASSGRVARAERAPGPAPVPRVPARRRGRAGLPPARPPEQSPAGPDRPRAGAGPRARAVRRLRADLRAPEAHRGARARVLRRNAPGLDDCRRPLGPTGAARASQPAAPAAARLSRRTRPDRRLRARLVRRPRPGVHAPRLRRRRHQPANGAVLRRRRVHVRLLPGHPALPRAARQADGLLQRPAECLPRPRPRPRSGRARALAVRPRPPRAQHRAPLRPQPGSQGPRRTGPRHPARPARPRAAPAPAPPSRGPPPPLPPALVPAHTPRSARPPAAAYDAHRPRRPEDDLAKIFTPQETRRVSRQLTVHYKRDLYVLDDTVATRRLRGATVDVREAEDGTVTLHAQGRPLAARCFPKDHAQLAPGAVVEYPHLDGVFTWIAAQQRARDAARLANRKPSGREKQ